MGRARTIKRHKKFSQSTRADKKRKLTLNLADYSSRAELKDRKFMIEAVEDALLDGDAAAVREILASHLEHVEKESFYKSAGISRRELFNLLKPEASPTLNNLSKICKALAKAA